jgi:ABC-type nitrate/sulfonate/bicarbonate transport system permease component
MAAALDFASPARNRAASVWALRIAIIAAVLALWELVAESGGCSATSCPRFRSSAAQSREC